MGYKQNKKVLNQNLFDFVITNYGGMDELYEFLSQNNIKDFSNFEDISKNTELLTPNKTENIINETFKDKLYYNKTGITIFGGNFNDDFNEDFFI